MHMYPPCLAVVHQEVHQEDLRTDPTQGCAGNLPEEWCGDAAEACPRLFEGQGGRIHLQGQWGY